MSTSVVFIADYDTWEVLGAVDPADHTGDDVIVRVLEPLEVGKEYFVGVIGGLDRREFSTPSNDDFEVVTGFNEGPDGDYLYSIYEMQGLDLVHWDEDIPRNFNIAKYDADENIVMRVHLDGEDAEPLPRCVFLARRYGV